ncbi:hypothetical protein CONPUDRAFT_160632 [Coniophora puteana RWD-64-598 SS2]|uniref:Decapping nuclease n=1 Tax=Coniophora puteana (strain RWD-64-598) TaxID=741705 RepID=R7SDB5_CONPW|nr:uncharacterized protein CONPUDRAFT_160632 [Coniophora puteana RWD-64-598 SS2]EIW73855.1 hypothetical protein CONPUDRAFT_160632 [Coniophora puteana RWD-64-598 SS2]
MSPLSHNHALVPLTSDLGEQLATFQHPSSVSAPVEITNVIPIASYSCVMSNDALKMIVPEAVLWAFASPLALFIAVDTIHGASFKYDIIDIITERNTLRKLLRWVTNSDPDPFRIDIQRTGNACILTKVKTADHSRQHPGYGLGFEEATTRPAVGCEKAAAHHRIISYSLGGLNVLLRFEVDACLDTKCDTSPTRADGSTTSDIHGLSVEVQSSLELVPQSSLIEIKTRSLKNKIRWDETFRQLYLSQTEWLYVGKHKNGIFNDVTKERLKEEASVNMKRRKQAAETNEMAKLKVLLDGILREVRKVDEGVPLTLLREGTTLMLYRKQGHGETIPEKILRRFRN